MERGRHIEIALALELRPESLPQRGTGHFPGDAETKNRLRATHLAVDLSDVERTDIEDALDNDTEESVGDA